MEQKKQSFHVKKLQVTFVGTQPSVKSIFSHPLSFLPLEACLLFIAQSKLHFFTAFCHPLTSLLITIDPSLF